MTSRRAVHAGSWYSGDARELNGKLEGWLSKTNPTHRPAKAIIAPHAGYSYCGSCAAHAYRQIDPVSVKRIFILGPSHHVHIPGCALSSLAVYITPFYNLLVDNTVNNELMATGEFERMSKKTDEEEHSIEMHLPYIAKVMESKRGHFTIVPILVGSLSPEKESKYGKLLSKYLMDPDNVFIVSSDFCHWGRRFHYVNFDRGAYRHIYQFIEALDRKGMDVIERLDPQGFTEYLKKHQNTICGRHPIGVLLNAVQALAISNGYSAKWAFKFLHYTQSSLCQDFDDSSVSYAAGALTFG